MQDIRYQLAAVTLLYVPLCSLAPHQLLDPCAAPLLTAGFPTLVDLTLQKIDEGPGIGVGVPLYLQVGVACAVPHRLFCCFSAVDGTVLWHKQCSAQMCRILGLLFNTIRQLLVCFPLPWLCCTSTRGASSELTGNPCPTLLTLGNTGYAVRVIRLVGLFK